MMYNSTVNSNAKHERMKKMAVLMIVLGIVMVLGGISCVFAPVMTFVGTGYITIVIAAAMMIVYGVMNVVQAVRDKEYGVNMLFGILSVIAGAVLFIPGMRIVAGGAALYIVSFWFIVKGLVTMFLSLNMKRVSGGKEWIFGIILGVLGVLLGIVSCIKPIVSAALIGLWIGIYLIETGADMIILGWNARNIK